MLAALLVTGCGDPARERLEGRFRGLLEEAARARHLPRTRVHPALLQTADPVQLHRCLRWLAARGGEFQGLAPASFVPAERALGEARAEGGDVTARFSSGGVALSLLFVGDQLAHLEVKDELRRMSMAEHLATAPEDTATRERFSEVGKAFWARALMSAEAKAFAMLHPGLRRSLPGPEALRPSAGLPSGDAVQEIVHVGSRRDPEHPGKLHLLQRVRGPDGEVPAHVTLQFSGLQVHLVGFQYPSLLSPIPPLAAAVEGSP